MTEHAGQIVFYASDSLLAIEGMKMLFTAQEAHTVVYTAQNLGGLQDNLNKDLDPEPTVLLIDPAFPTHVEGEEAVEKFKKKYPSAKVVTISLTGSGVIFGDKNLVAPVPRESLFETLTNL